MGVVGDGNGDGDGGRETEEDPGWTERGDVWSVTSWELSLVAWEAWWLGKRGDLGVSQ
jgi:hypothetical protein